MGNQQCICCQQKAISDKKDLPQVTVTTLNQSIRMPELPFPVLEHLSKYKPYQAQMVKNGKRKKFGRDIYQGYLNYKNKPQGFGIMYYSNGSVFVGQFTNGTANGSGHFVFPNGSYYHGAMVNNKAQTEEGEFISDQLTYRGGFKNNMFQGNADQKGRFHQFKGQYHQHKKKRGVFKWVQNQYDYLGEVAKQNNTIYEGSFDEDGLFTGQGILINQYGQYKGNFMKGVKQGKGTFQYKVGLKYVGEYINGIKEGIGTVFAKSGVIAFSGQWRHGLPNGKGFVVNNFGDKVKLTWNDGIDERLLQKTQKTTQ